MAPRHGDDGMSFAYCQLFIQPIRMRRSSGASLNETAA
jgi:hypothetical protein